MSALATSAGGFPGQRVMQPGLQALMQGQEGRPGGAMWDLLTPFSQRAAYEGANRIFHCADYAQAFSSTDVALHAPRWRCPVSVLRVWLRVCGQKSVMDSDALEKRLDSSMSTTCPTLANLGGRR